MVQKTNFILNLLSYFYQNKIFYQKKYFGIKKIVFNFVEKIPLFNHYFEPSNPL